MRADSSQFQRAFMKSQGYPVSSTDPDFEFVRALEPFEPERWVSGVGQQEAKLLFRPCLNVLGKRSVILQEGVGSSNLHRAALS